MPRPFWTLAALLARGCAPSRPGVDVVRLVDVFDQATLDRSPAVSPQSPPLDWRYLQEGHGVAGLTIDGDRLTGRSSLDLPIVHLVRRDDGEDPVEDELHHVELRLRASGGTNLAITFSDSETLDLTGNTLRSLWPLQSPIAPGEEMQSYVLTPTRSIPRSSIRSIHLSPTDAPNVDFVVESVRLVFRTEHLASIPSGVSWQGFGEIYRETIVTRSPESLSFDVTLPERPRLSLALGTVERAPVTFRVEVSPRGSGETKQLLVKTVTKPQRWEEVAVSLDELSGTDVTVTLSTEAATDAALGFWGSPAFRRTSEDSRGVILFVTDTLRRDRLSTYGHDRETSPVLSRLAGEGALFLDNQSQATWTKVSMPSMLTSLYPTTHGVVDFPDRIPASATTLAEAFRAAGYATVALTANGFVGRATNLHQGFEVFYEQGSVPAEERDARPYLDNALPWIESHRDVPFFILVHVTDPHWPYPSYPPYDSLWGDPGDRSRHEALVTRVRPRIRWAFNQRRGLPNKTELEDAGIDAQEFVEPELDWYDGSIRGVDVEIGRLMETLRNANLHQRTLLVFTSDHGEEFLEHGNHWHGLNAYGENSNVPLVMWGPGRIPAGVTVEETVQNIDIMPTLLELSGLPLPEGIQGQSLVPLLTDGAPSRWRRRPAVVERANDSGDEPETPEAIALVMDGFRLVKLTHADGSVEYELYDHENDPLNLENIASDHPDVVERLSSQLSDWQQWAQAAKLPSDEEAASEMSAEQLERLRSLGYVQ